jgi:uncharacterized NAD-dependent epimerase/dehydratase family protein
MLELAQRRHGQFRTARRQRKRADQRGLFTTFAATGQTDNAVR